VTAHGHPRLPSRPATATRAATRAAALALALLAAPAGALAGTGHGPAVPCAEGAPRAARTWPAPLDRVLALRAEDVSLGVALERLAAGARVHFSYSPELVPVARTVCVVTGRMAVGDLLVVLLAGTGIGPVVAGDDHVVLTPSRSAAGSDATPSVVRSIGRLERVVVTGTAAGGSERGSPHALSVVDGPAQAQGGTRSMAEMLDAAVPGVWLWSQSPLSPLARYGSIRGASSFGVSSPKVYIDGIEVANPLLLRQLDPARVQRIEVIRGPQGAALYGADAISGVVQIVTRHDGVGVDAPRAELRGSAGSASSTFADGGVLAQDHSATLRTGTAARSAALGLTVSTLGAFIPGAGVEQFLLHGSARHVGARAVSTATVRLDAANTDAPDSPLLGAIPYTPMSASAALRASRQRAESGGAWLPGSPGPAVADAAGQQRTRQYTVGASSTIQASDRWTHVLTAGVDGYRLAGVVSEGMLVPSATDSALRAARGGADRGSLRLSSTARLGSPETRGLSLTLGAEHSTAREQTNGAGTRLQARGRPMGGGPGPTSTQPGTTWWSNTGVLAQGQLSLRNRLFVTGGARVEHVTGPAEGAQVALLPMLGGAWVHERGAFALKLRTAYGRGIRPARTVARGATWSGGRVDGALTSLEPEEQSGVEFGADLLWGSRLGLHVTRFDQRASGLVQPVAVLADTAAWPGTGGPMGGGRRESRIAYVLQNVGAIENRGWELQATSAAGPIRLAATLSLVGSRVDRLATGYQGDLRAGDRILEVPGRTYGLTAGWSHRQWSASAWVARAADWINYDRLALASAFAAAGTPGMSGPPGPRPPVGAQLRSYWRPYDGVTRIGARATMLLWRDASLTLTGTNLLDRQLGEPDNVTVLPGRTLTLGIRTGF
jgi:hypothetical protein